MSETHDVRAPRQTPHPAGAGPSVTHNGMRFWGGLVFKAHKLLHHSTLGLTVTNKKKEGGGAWDTQRACPTSDTAPCRWRSIFIERMTSDHTLEDRNEGIT